MPDTLHTFSAVAKVFSQEKDLSAKKAAETLNAVMGNDRSAPRAYPVKARKLISAQPSLKKAS